MKIIDLYTHFIEQFSISKNLRKVLQSHPELEKIFKMATEWGIDLHNVENWVKSEQYKLNQKSAQNFTKVVEEVVGKVEGVLGQKLVGEIKLTPSLMRFDGFARYDQGSHTVLFGVDHPDADEEYLRVLMAHELSHVYRDHQPDVWGFLGKPLKNVSRQEYLDNISAEEHLVSEGLATLFSQVVYPEAPLHVHHYYTPEEMKWCFENSGLIEKEIKKCLADDQNVWKFYEEDVVAQGSPSRVQYFWAAQRIRDWLEKNHANYDKALIKAHTLAAKEFKCFD